MVAGLLFIRLRLFSITSIKGKRSTVTKIKERVRNKFNVSVSEVGQNDNLHFCELGIATVSNDKRLINSALDSVLNFIAGLFLGEIIFSNFEIVTFKESFEDNFENRFKDLLDAK